MLLGGRVIVRTLLMLLLASLLGGGLLRGVAADEADDSATGYKLVFEVAEDDARVTPDLLRVIHRRLGDAQFVNRRVRPLGDRQLEVDLPDAKRSQLDRVQQLITATGIFEFRVLATPRRHQAIIAQAGATDTIVRSDEKIVARWVTFDPKQLKLDESSVVTRKKNEISEILVLEHAPSVDGSLLKSAQPNRLADPPTLSLELTDTGGERLRALTREYQPDDAGNVFHLGVIMDGQLLIAPAIRAEISARAELSGLAESDVDVLSVLLSTGRLPVALRKQAISIKPHQEQQWVIDTIAGTGKPERGAAAGAAEKINVGDPFGVEIGPDGALYITEVRNHRVWRLDLATRQLRVVAGNGTKGYAGDGGPATQAALNEPYEVRFDAEANMYFVEMQNHLVRRVDAGSGVIRTVAGIGERGYAGDGGPAISARFNNPHSIALDGRGGLYIADIGNHRIRRVDLASGTVETIAGNGERTLPENGQPAQGRALLGPRALWIADQSLWIGLREGHSIWRLSLDRGQLWHLAGTGARGFTGDGGPGNRATFDGPKGIALDAAGNIYVADTENNAVRRIDATTGAVRTIAGSGPDQGGFGGDGGDAKKAKLHRPHGVCVGPDGAVYVGDTLNHRVRRIRLVP
jgi:sugar lactone lactonase YvrE